MDTRNLPPRPPMHVFPELSSQILDQEPPRTHTHQQSMYSYPNTQQIGSSTSTSLEVGVSDMKSLLCTFSNETIKIKR